MDSPKSATKTNTRTIYKVHEHLRDVNKKAYEPEIIAIGPYHRDKGSLKMMEEHKKRYLESLLDRKKQNRDIYISTMDNLKEDARKCYAEPISLSSEEFTNMLVLDGCFIIELIRKDRKNDATCKDDPIFQMDWLMDSLQRDLLLFENQIPFFVLRTLYDLIEAPGQPERLIYLVFKFWENLYPGKFTGNRKTINPEQIKHLLGLLHQFCCPARAADHVYIDIDGSKKNMSLVKRYRLLDKIQRCCRPPSAADDHDRAGADKSKKAMSPEKRNQLLGNIQRSCHPSWAADDHDRAGANKSMKTMSPEKRCRSPSASNRKGRKSYIIRSATELTNANVTFQKKKDSRSTLFDVEFKQGRMRMPPLTIEDRTECFFRNLIAYEQYFPDGQPSYIADYARLLNCLIDSQRDVEILSQAEILNNLLGDDKVVAKIVNHLNKTISHDHDQAFIYAPTFERVNNHCQKHWNRSCAALKRDYCSSPWATVAVLAASAILLLTITQTVCSILQVRSVNL